MESNKTTPSFIESTLYYIAGFMLFSSIMYTLSGNSDKWFGRVFLSIVALGFAGIMREIRKSRK